MKKSLLQKVLCVLLSATTLFGLVGFTAAAATSSGEKRGSNRDTASSLEEMQALVGVPTYEEYLDEYDYEHQSGLPGVSIDINDIVAGSSGVKPSLSDYCLNSWKENQKNWSAFNESDWDNSIYLPSEGYTTWNFHVPEGQGSYYYIKITYFSCITEQSSISQIERKVFIDGKAPFKEASTISFNKGWKYDNVTVSDPIATSAPDGSTTEYELREDGYYRVVTSIKNGIKTVTSYKIAQDINGNSMQPMIVQSPEWNTYYIQDSTGYYDGYLRFYFSSGTHQFTLSSQREPVIVKSIELVPYDPEMNATPKYEDVLKDYAANGYKPADGNITIIESEFPHFVSDSSVYPTNDGTSCITYPTSSQSQLFNVIGENSYNTIGQWAAYKFSVDATGLYKISMRYLQKTLEGMYVCRAVKFAGGHYGDTPIAPFEEAYDIQFDYNKNWQSTYISDSNGTEFDFYFEAGVEYTLYVECSLGSLKDIIQRVEKSVEILNDCYLQIIQLTGSSADPYRTYEFMEIMPHVVRELLVQAIELMEIKEKLESLCGTSGTHTATLETVARLLDKMGSDRGDNIAANLSNFKSYLGTLGTWVNDSKTGKLIIDTIYIAPSDSTKKDLPAKDANFFKATWFEITSFIYSFFTDYNSMGLTSVPDEDSVAIDVWLQTGRDQANIWRSMLDAQNGFTDSTGYAVRLKLIAGGLLPSILAGKGPDVYMGLGEDSVINYSIRGAIMGVSGNFKHEKINNDYFNKTYYTYRTDSGYEVSEEYRGEDGLSFVSLPFKQYVSENFVQSAMDTITLLEVSYGVPQTMDFSMMFYRMDVLADLGLEVPETWTQMLAMLPVFQANNMEIGVTYMNAL
ncbi:MAG: extracellular solute-binding protein, partial [Clostridia bacterium]|nr:extracellular solute-binding protein [Clostridia bacterium]